MDEVNVDISSAQEALELYSELHQEMYEEPIEVFATDGIALLISLAALLLIISSVKHLRKLQKTPGAKLLSISIISILVSMVFSFVLEVFLEDEVALYASAAVSLMISVFVLTATIAYIRIIKHFASSKN